MCLYCVSKVSDCFSKKLWYKLISPHMHYLCINKMLQELQREITLTELALAIFILLQMSILWIAMCLQSLMKFHHCLFKILRKKQNIVDKELQRAITLTEFAPSPFYSNTNVHIVDINVFAKFDEIPSLPIQDIKEKTKCCGQRITKGNNSNRIGPEPLFFFYKCSSCGYQCVHKTSLMKFHHCLFKLLRKNQNVAD